MNILSKWFQKKEPIKLTDEEVMISFEHRWGTDDPVQIINVSYPHRPHQLQLKFDNE